MNKSISAMIPVLLMIVSTLLMITPHVYGAPPPSWSSDVRLTTDPHIDARPAVIGTADGRLLIMWESYRTGRAELYYRRLPGVSSDVPLPMGTSENAEPSLSKASDGTLWMSWWSNRTGAISIYAQHSSDNGLSWSGLTTVSPDFAGNYEPSIAALSNGKIMVAWRTNLQGSDDIYYRLFNSTWMGPLLALTNNPAADSRPSVLQASDGRVWVVWSSDRGPLGAGVFGLYYTIGVPSGDTINFGSQLPLTDQSQNYDNMQSAVAQDSNGTLWLAWQNDKDDPTLLNTEIYFKRGFNNGSLWEADTRLTVDVDNIDMGASVTQDKSGVVWVAWASSRDGNFEIYYKTAPLPQWHDIAATGITPQKNYVYQGYNATIAIGTQNNGSVAEPNVSVKLYANNTFAGQTTVSLLPGDFKIVFITWKTVPSTFRVGWYTLKSTVNASSLELSPLDNSYTAVHAVQVRIPGDTDGNNIVDLDDVLRVATAWGSPTYNPAADINGNGVVDLDDVLTTAVNWGKTA